MVQLHRNCLAAATPQIHEIRGRGDQVGQHRGIRLPPDVLPSQHVTQHGQQLRGQHVPRSHGRREVRG